MKIKKNITIILAVILLMYNACSTSSPIADKSGITYAEINIPQYSPVKGSEHAEITIVDFSGFL